MNQNTEDRNIEDYLFGDYLLNSKSTFEKDQNFAKPIEDEDIFGIGCHDQWAQDGQSNMLESNDGQMELEEEIPDLGGHIYKDLTGASPHGSIFDDNIEPLESTASDLTHKPASELDDIFRDDYSESSQNNHIALNNNENTYPGASKKKLPPPPPTPAQIKKKLFKEKVLEQARAKNRAPQKPGADLKQDGVIEVEIIANSLISNQESKFIFNRLFNKSKRASPKSEKKCWATYKDNLRKKICSQKRKVWDSFQCRIMVDEEDEFIEPEVHKEHPDKDRTSETDNNSEDELDASINDINNDEDNDEFNGNFEDLEREDLGSDDSQSCDEDDAKDLVDNEDNKSDLGSESNGSDMISEHTVEDKEEEEPQNEVVNDDDGESSSKDSYDDDEEDVSSTSKNDLNDFSLNLDESSNETQEVDKRKRRAILIDDEASEED